MGAVGSSSWLSNSPVIQAVMLQIRSRVDEESWLAARLEGQALTEEQAITECLALQGEHEE